VNIKLELYERFVITPVDDVQRTPDELGRRRGDLDAVYEGSAATANSLESRLRAYFEGTSVAEAWHGAWDCLVVRYFSMIVPDKATLDILNVFILILERPGIWPDPGRRVGFRHDEAPGK
jgi:hypothetical protein